MRASSARVFGVPVTTDATTSVRLRLSGLVVRLGLAVCDPEVRVAVLAGAVLVERVAGRDGVGRGEDPRDVVYARSAGEHRYALDLATGVRLWSTERGASVGTMAAADGRLFVALGDGALVAQAPPD